MKQSTFIQGQVVEQELQLTLVELCLACSTDEENVLVWVVEGVLEPIGESPPNWRFSGESLRRSRLALRLANDLEINLPGVALALDLLDEIAGLRARLQELMPESGQTAVKSGVEHELLQVPETMPTEHSRRRFSTWRKLKLRFVRQRTDSSIFPSETHDKFGCHRAPATPIRRINMNQAIQVLKPTRNGGSPLHLGSAKAGTLRVTAITGLLLLAACASVPPPPTQALQAAESAIATADRARVADYASMELTEARQNLTAANNAVQREDMALAQQLAEQSRVNAELASAKAEAAKARTVNDEMQKSINTLKQEMQRNTGARQ